MLAAFCSCCCSQRDDRLIRVVRTQSEYALFTDVHAEYLFRCNSTGVETAIVIYYGSSFPSTSAVFPDCSSVSIIPLRTFGQVFELISQDEIVHYIKFSDYESFTSGYNTTLPPADSIDSSSGEFISVFVNSFEIQEI